MGIKGLKQFLRDKFGTCIQPSHLSKYDGKKIALDLLTYLYRYKVVFGENWRHGLFHLFTTFIKFNVHLTVIMDGPAVHKEKEKEREKRKAGRNKIQAKIDALVHDLDVFERTGDSTELLLKISNPSHKQLLVDVKQTVSIPLVKKEIKKLRQQIVSITSEDITLIEQLCASLSIPFYMASQEAESLASYLCITNQVHMVVSEDTDVLAYGCPLWMSNIAHDGSCLVVSSEDVLREMKLSRSQFIDFCILCGTDYNDTLKKVGPISAYKAIQKVETIDAFLEENPHLKEEEFPYKLVRTFFINPCQQAITNREHQHIRPITITFNSLPDENQISQLQDRYPVKKFIEWLKNYPMLFVLE